MNHGIAEIWKRRTSREFICDGRLTASIMRELLEAAGRAPSSYNAQPWRFWYGRMDTLEWKKLHGLLAHSNGAWASSAEWLILVGADQVIHLTDKRIHNDMAEFDAGAACLSLALQATALGFGCATVGGFNRSRAAVLINNPEIKPLVMMVVGSVPQQEIHGSQRKLVEEIATHDFDGEVV